MYRRQFLKAATSGLGSLLLGVGASSQPAKKKIEIRGAYSSPDPFWQKGVHLGEYGIDAVFIHAESIDTALIQRCRAEGARVFAEFPAFNGGGWLTQQDGDRQRVIDEHADAWPIDEKGQRSPRQTWFLGICPTNETFLRARLEALKRVVTSHKLDGVWLDYLHWHAQFEDPKPLLPETCFNESCVRRFQAESGLTVRGTRPEEWAQDILGRYQERWRDWRCSVVVDFARRCREILWQHAPQLVLGNFQCAWRDDEYGGARRRTLGLDLRSMAQVFDVMSPMLYHGRSGHSTDWVGRNVKWLCNQLRLTGTPSERLKVWPIIQAWSDPNGQKVSSGEFEKVLWGAVTGCASGVMMFTIGAVAEDDQKMAVLRKVYGMMKGQG